MVKNYFHNSNKIGDIASEAVRKLYENDGWEVISVEKDPEYQAMDIDLYARKGNEECYLEIKADTYVTGNFFLETIGNTNTGSLGCVYQTQADYICYYFVKTKELYFIDTVQLQEWLRENEHRYKSVNVKTTGSKGEAWYSNEGKVVPIRDVVNAVWTQKNDLSQIA